MQEIFIKDDYIKLGQVLKLAGLTESGVESKIVISEGMVRVNGEVEYRRGKKCIPGDIITYHDNELVIEKDPNDH